MPIFTHILDNLRSILVESHGWTGFSATLVLVFMLSASVGDAAPGPCPPVGVDVLSTGSEESPRLDADVASDAGPTSLFRQKAALFAPEILLRLWYKNRTDHQNEARSFGLTAWTPRRPDIVISDHQKPFGWQVSLRWNLLEIADAFLPQDARHAHIYASDCPDFIEVDEASFGLDSARFEALVDAQEAVE